MSDTATIGQCPPWLLTYWQQLHQRHEEGRLPHAILFAGVDGIGKVPFTRFVADALLCRQSSASLGACGSCESCAQRLAGAHPDFRAVDPEGAAMNIKVDTVRDLVNWLQLSAPPERYRVAIIDQADAMNHAAANSLLKTLEEPGERCVLLLAATRPGSLPATIRSRCQQIVLNVDDKPAAAKWLNEQGVEHAQDAVMRARVAPYSLLKTTEKEWQANQHLLEKAWLDLFLMRASVGKIVDSLKDLPTTRCLAAFAHWVSLATRAQLKVPVGADPATNELISQVQNCIDCEQWFTLYDRLVSLHRSDSTSFKTQAVLEGIFADIRIMTNG